MAAPTNPADYRADAEAQLLKFEIGDLSTASLDFTWEAPFDGVLIGPVQVGAATIGTSVDVTVTPAGGADIVTGAAVAASGPMAMTSTGIDQSQSVAVNVTGTGACTAITVSFWFRKAHRAAS